MSGLGVHFAISQDDLEHILALDEEERLAFLTDEIEERFFEHEPEFLAENDRSWEAAHFALCSLTGVERDGGYPLTHVILGGEHLYSGDWLMILKSTTQVRDIADALRELTEEDFRRGYDAIDEGDYRLKSDEDRAYTWDWFQDVRDLYDRAAEAHRAVLFTADR